MKRYASCLVMIVTMFLGASSLLESAASIAEHAGGSALARMSTEAATESLMQAGIKSVSKQLADSFAFAAAKMQDDVVTKALAKSAPEMEASVTAKMANEAFLEGAGKGLAGDALQKAAESAVKADMQAAAEIAVKSEVEASTKMMVKNAASLQKFGVDISKMSPENLLTASGDDLTKLVKNAGTPEGEAALKTELTSMGVADNEVARVASSMKNSQALLDDVAKTGQSGLKKAPVAEQVAGGAKATTVERELVDKTATKAEAEASGKAEGQLSDEELNQAMNSLKSSSSFESRFAKSTESSSAYFNTMMGKTDSALEREYSWFGRKFGYSGSVLTKEEQAAARQWQEVLANPNATPEARAIAAKGLNDAEYKAATNSGKLLRRIDGMAEFIKPALPYIALTIAAGVLFMVPSLFQSMYLAKQQQNAMLETYGQPVQFGNIVMQLPDSVINVGNPMMSQFVYYGIPVNHTGAALSAQAKAAYPGISGPTSNNKISKAADNSMARFAGGTSTKKIHIDRYNLDAQALATLPMFVSYPTASWGDLGTQGIPDPMFSQVMLNLNTGRVFYADGSSQGIPAASLLGPKPQGGLDTVQSFMNIEYGKLAGTGLQATFTEFKDWSKNARADKVSNPVLDQFNCSCLAITENNGVLSGDVVKKCSDSKTCLLTSTLNQLSAGLVLNADGKVMTPDQDLADEVAKGALGQIIPIQGLGDKLTDLLQSFPGAQQNILASTGTLTVSLDEDETSSEVATLQGAEPDNYAAKGVYVYQCKNTPLAKMLRKQSGGSDVAYDSSQLTDYIVFLDSDLNQVPLMTPMSDPKNYHFITMGLNPAIKYFSTIIGNMDGSGAFTFLPQLDIKASAAAQAKGIPAKFAPLYGLKAAHGSLSVSYNQSLSGSISSVAQSLVGHGKLGQQFKSIQAAIMGLLAAGPFGKYNLRPVAAQMQPTIQGVHLSLYKGFNAYPATQDQDSANCTDVLIPLSIQGTATNTVTLPSNSVNQYYGLVTDFTYSVLPDGTITVEQAGFANSAFDPKTWSIDATKAKSYYWLDKLTAMGKSSDPSFAMPESLVDFVAKSRAVWIAWVKSAAASGLKKSEFAGVTIPGSSTMLTTVSQQALAHGLYIYNCAPCPSSLAQDYFVLTNSQAPQATDTKLGSMSVTEATASTNLLSLVSGLLYTSAGTLVKNSAGAGYSVNVTALLKSLSGVYGQALSNDLKIKLNIASGNAASAAVSMVYPFNFGGLQVGLYQADMDKQVYIYFDAAGAGASTDFEPQDYFVAVDSYKNPVIMGTQLSATTAYMVSVVTGKAYGPSGVVGTVPASVLKSIVGKLSPQWTLGVASQIKTLGMQQAAKLKDAAAVTAAMDAQPVANDGNATWSQGAVAKIIAGLASQSYLPEPYSMLKYDGASGHYVIISPADAQGSESMYTFANVPNDIIDAQGKKSQVAASYDKDGNLIHVFDGLARTSLLQLYGIGVDADGKEHIGASNPLPIMKLDPADRNLQPGVSGKSMICSTDPNFPSHGITSPISYANMQYYFYYNTLTQSYYAMQINGSDICYIDMAGGAVYGLTGISRLVLNPVAVASDGDMTKLLLPYLNTNGLMRCIMQNVDNKNTYSDFLNSEADFKLFVKDIATKNVSNLNVLYSLDEAVSKVDITQMPTSDTLTGMLNLATTQEYNVYFDASPTPVVYMTNPNYKWQSLQLLPVSMDSHALLSPLPDTDTFGNARLVMKGSAMYALLFAGKLYANAQQNGAGSYSMTSGADKIIASMKVDAATNAPYVEVVAGSTTYNYQCNFLNLLDAQLSDLRQNAWQSIIVPDVKGNVLLEQYISTDASEKVKLSPVSMNSVMNIPNDTAVKSALTSNVGSIMQDSKTGRFIVAIDAGKYPYFKDGGYVDLENGVLFDTAGVPVGIALQYKDFVTLLSTLSVGVARDSKDKAVLSYQLPSTLVQDSLQQVRAEDKQVDALKTSSGSRSSLMGRFSSNKSKKPAIKSKKAMKGIAL